MAPLVPVFSAETLPDHVNTVRRNFQEKRRKGPAIDLKECALLEMMQYSCNPPQDGIPQPGAVVCKPVVRLFRRCAGGLTVETTSWEPLRIAEEEAAHKRDVERRKWLDQLHWAEFSVEGLLFFLLQFRTK